MSRWITENPFYVLELRPEAGAAQVKAQGEKLLVAQRLGLVGAHSYPTPLGPRARDAKKIRWALAELDDGEQRPLHELWARLEPEREADPPQTDPVAPWPEARRWLRR